MSDAPAVSHPALVDVGAPARVVAIGDVHGDLDALVRILLGMAVISRNGHEWVGGDTCLVLLGDLNDRGNDSVAVMDFLMALQPGAARSAGSVHALIGNHEIMAAEGDFRYVSASETLAIEGWWFDDVNGLHAVYRGRSPYAAWLRQRPVMLKTRDHLFVHAGLDRWALELDLADVANGVRAWIAHLQGVAPEPDESTFWMISEDGLGPLWTDRLRVSEPPLPDRAVLADVFEGVLRRDGVDRLVVGHKPTALLDFRIAFPHPAFGERVALIDTGISRRYGGRLSALELADGRLRSHYFERGAGELDITREIRAAAVRNRERIAGENAARAAGPSTAAPPS